MRLLLCLAEHAGQVVSIDQLLEEVWSGVIVTPDSVYQAVASLRRVLGDDRRNPTYIATVPRLGYRMVAAVAPCADDPTISADRLLGPPTASDHGGTELDSHRVPDVAPPRRKIGLAGIAAAALLVSVVAYLIIANLNHARFEVSGRFRSASLAPRPEKSIAVLPFIDLTEEMQQQYFADGMTEELIAALTKIPSLRVPARTSSFYFKGKQATIREIADALGVAYVLEGSVRKSKDTLRITAQLIRSDTGYHVWSKTYDRPVDNILMVQNDIAAEVTTSLQASLDDIRGATPPAENTPAYAAYFQARAMGRGAETGATMAQQQAIVDYLHQSIGLDPGYAPAWAELARALVHQSDSQFVLAENIRDEAQSAAGTALRLDPNLPAAHLAMGIVEQYLGWDWMGAEREYRRVMELEPGFADVYWFLGTVKMSEGNLEEARTLILRSISLDPLDARNYGWIGFLDYSLGRFSEAKNNYRKAQELSPTAHLAGPISEVQLAEGQFTASLETIQRETDDSARTSGLALVHFALGQKEDADRELTSLKSRHANDSAFRIAELHAYRGEIDQAFEWLDRAALQRDSSCMYVKIDPLLKNIRADARYHAFLNRMKLTH